MAFFVASSTTKSAFESSCFRKTSRAFAASAFARVAVIFDASAARTALSTSTREAFPISNNFLAVSMSAYNCAEIVCARAATSNNCPASFFSSSVDINAPTSRMMSLPSRDPLTFFLMYHTVSTTTTTAITAIIEHTTQSFSPPEFSFPFSFIAFELFMSISYLYITFFTVTYHDTFSSSVAKINTPYLFLF